MKNIYGLLALVAISGSLAVVANDSAGTWPISQSGSSMQDDNKAINDLLEDLQVQIDFDEAVSKYNIQTKASLHNYYDQLIKTKNIEDCNAFRKIIESGKFDKVINSNIISRYVCHQTIVPEVLFLCRIKLLVGTEDEAFAWYKLVEAIRLHGGNFFAGDAARGNKRAFKELRTTCRVLQFMAYVSQSEEQRSFQKRVRWGLHLAQLFFSGNTDRFEKSINKSTMLIDLSKQLAEDMLECCKRYKTDDSLYNALAAVREKVSGEVKKYGLFQEL